MTPDMSRLLISSTVESVWGCYHHGVAIMAFSPAEDAILRTISHTFSKYWSGCYMLLYYDGEFAIAMVFKTLLS